MIETANHKERVSGGHGQAEQRRKILSLIDHHIAQCQREGNIGKLVVELEFMRGGNLKSPYVEYKASWRFLDKVEGLG
jgi:hypothetical protein